MIDLEYGSRILRHRIRVGAPSLCSDLDHLWSVAIKEIHEFQEGDTVQGTIHCLKVENNIGLLLQDKIEKFKELDLFALSAAAALHDIGTIKTVPGYARMEADHGERGAAILRDDSIWPQFFGDAKRRTTAVSLIISVHAHGEIDKLQENPFSVVAPPGLFLRSLAAIFRLADMLDTDYSRCPYILPKIRALRFSDAMEKWLARQGIGGWEFLDSKTIELQESSENNLQHHAVVKLAQLLNKEITASHQKYLENCPVLYETENRYLQDTVHIPYRFKLSEPEEYLSEYVDESKAFEEILERYLENLANNSSKINLEGLQTLKDAKPVDLEKVFIDVKVGASREWMAREPEVDKSLPIFEREVIKKKWKQRLTTYFELLSEDRCVTKVLAGSGINRAVILGEPGSGKTTIGQFLCWHYATQKKNKKQEEPVVPFLVTLLKFAREKKTPVRELSVADYLTLKVGEYLKRKCPDDFVTKCLSERRCIVVFDGLDEIVRIGEKDNIKREVLKFVNDYPDVQIIVTSRISGYEEMSFDTNQFLHFELRGLTPAQTTDFMHNWYKEAENDETERERKVASFIEALQDPDVKELALNPLLLTIMVLVHKAEADLPKQHAALYEKCAATFLVNRERSKDLLSYSEFDVTECHEYLGYVFHSELEKERSKQIEFSIQTLRDTLERFFQTHRALSENALDKKVEEFIDVVRRRVGLIVEKGHWVGFGHKCFQEYFAASYIRSNTYGLKSLWSYIKKRVFEPHWHQVMLLLGGILGNHDRQGLDDLINKLLSTDGSKRGIFLATEIAADKARMNCHTLNRVCNVVTKDFFRSHSSQLLISYLEILVDLLETDAAQYLLSELRSVSRDDRPRADSIHSQIEREMRLSHYKKDPRMDVLLAALACR